MQKKNLGSAPATAAMAATRIVGDKAIVKTIIKQTVANAKAIRFTMECRFMNDSAFASCVSCL